MSPRSIRTRITANLGVIALVMFGSVGVLLYAMLDRELKRAERDSIASKADIVRHFVDEMKSPGDIDALRHHLNDALIGHRELHIWILAHDGAVLYGSSPAPSFPTNDGKVSIARKDGSRLVGLRFELPPNAALAAADAVVAVDIRQRVQLLTSFGAALVVVCTIGFASTVGLSVWTIRRGLLPVRRLSGQAEQIGPDTLSRRLAIAELDRELRTLASAFNGLLDRLEYAYQQVEAFNSHVAHELRTPLANLISGTHVLLAAERTTQQLREHLATNLEDLEQLNRIVNDMLFLARADRGEPARDLSQASLADEARLVAEYFEAALQERHVALRIEGDARTQVGVSLMRRALVNLVANALRFTEPNRTIVVTIETRGERIDVVVRNPGPPIAPDDLPHIFDRFFAAGGPLAENSESHGLGLAIVRAIAKMHGGDTYARSVEGTTEVGFWLKVAGAPIAPELRPAHAEERGREQHEGRHAGSSPGVAGTI